MRQSTTIVSELQRRIEVFSNSVKDIEACIEERKVHDVAAALGENSRQPLRSVRPLSPHYLHKFGAG